MLNQLHGTIISYAGVGCLLTGASGTGKSRLAAEAMLLGAKLIADDQLTLSTLHGMLMGAPVKSLIGVIEMRNVGLVKIPDTTTQHVIHVGIELREDGHERLPDANTRTYEGIAIPQLFMPPVPQTTALYVLAAMKAVQEGRVLPVDWKPAAIA